MFDTADELLRKIRLGEDTTLELKAVGFRGDKVSEPQRADLADEIAAIANTAAGILVLGVSDDRDVVGLPLDRLDAVERFVFEICTDSIRPPVAFRTQRLELPGADDKPHAVLKVEIPRSLFVHQSPGGYFHRQGSSKRVMPPELLARLFQQRSQARLIRFDEQVVPETSYEDLDPELYRPFFGTSSDELTTLRKLRLLRDDDGGEERVSVAGVLLCTQEPHHWLPGAFIQAVYYNGSRPNSNVQLDAQDIQGPLQLQVRRALIFVERNMKVAARKDPAREDLPQYSLQAVFEAIVNAVAHRDYSIHGSKIRLFMFSDRLELYSPGSLPNTLTVDSLPLRQSTRNELVTSLLARSPVDDPRGRLGRRYLMEKRGEGVPIILDESRRLSGKEPVYRVLDDAEVMLTIWAADPGSTEGAGSATG
ncbi:MAG: transcriptional regulator [Rhodospirillales bacterium]|nr:transcriptional regulator [Rhodospirillales bacterium]